MAKITAYTTKEAADALAVSASSVRKYASALEEAGHRFAKTESGARLITEMDLKTLLRMKKLIGKGKTYIQAAEEAAKSAKVTEMIVQSVEEPSEMEELRQMIGQLTGEVRNLQSEIIELKELTHKQARLLNEFSQNRIETPKNEAAELKVDDEPDEVTRVEFQDAKGSEQKTIEPHEQIPAKQELQTDEQAVTQAVMEKNSTDNKKSPEPKRRGLFERLFGRRS